MPVAFDGDDTLRYSGRVDAYVDVKGSAFGLDDSFTLTLRPEFTWGKDSNGVVGLIPDNTALFRGEGRGDFDVSASVSKRWKSGAKLTLGKVNVLDLGAKLPVVGSNGHYGFQNLSTALPPSAIIPNTLTGALLEVPTEKVLYRLWVYDPDSQYERTGFETAFGSGVGFLGSVTFPVKIGGAPGYYALKLSGSTRDDINADSLPSVLIPAPGSSFGNSRGEFAAVLAGYQYLSVYPEAPGKGWGIFGQIYQSIGDPTFLDASGFIGMSGNPRGRPQDRFGAAWFRYSLTDDLVSVLAPRLGLEDEEGVEVFYTVGIADRFEVTANAQVIDSAVAARDAGVLVGMRLNANF
ncbi:MAG: carbohydrate porin [Pseudomonadota bacterium]